MGEPDSADSSTSSVSLSLGPYCDQLQIQTSTFLKDLERVDPHGLKNGHLVEMYIHIRSTKIPWCEVQQSLVIGSPKDWSEVPRWVLPTTFTGIQHCNTPGL